MKKKLLSREILQDKIFNNTYNAMASLVESCYFTQLSISPNLINGIGGEAQSAWKEYCTVKMGTSRGSGHSTAICNIALNYFKKALILTPKEDMALKLRDKFQDIVGDVSKIEYGTTHTIRIDYDNEYYFHTTNRIENLRGFEFEAVFVDCASFVSREKIEKIYTNLGPSMAKHPENFFIFVQ